MQNFFYKNNKDGKKCVYIFDVEMLTTPTTTSTTSMTTMTTTKTTTTTEATVAIPDLTPDFSDYYDTSNGGSLTGKIFGY